MNVTAFQEKIYAVARQIPKGKVASYGDLAKAAGAGSARSVGQAMRKNPFAPEVPCHRVVRSDGSIGGFGGDMSGPKVEEKRGLLLSEGVVFSDPQHVHPSCFHRFEARAPK